MTRNFRIHLLGVLALSAAFLGSTARAEESTSGTMTISGGNKPAVTLSSSVSAQITPEQAAKLKAGTPVTINGERVGEIESVDYSKESSQARLKIKIDLAAKKKLATGGPFEAKAGDVPIKLSVTRTGASLKADRTIKRVEDVKIETKPEAEKPAAEKKAPKESSFVSPKASLDQLASSVSELRSWADSAPEAAAIKADVVALETSVKGIDANQNLVAATNEVVRQARELSTKLQDAGLGEKAENLDEAVAELRIDLARNSGAAAADVRS